MTFRPIAIDRRDIPPPVDFQSNAGLQGKAMEDATITLLRMHGWTINARHFKVEGQEIDIVATDNNGVEWWIECKGSWEGTRPGGKRTDTLKKAVAVAWFLTTVVNRQPYMLVLSHRPPVHSTGDVMLQRAIDYGLFDRVWTITDLGEV